ncbi:MAG: hypothetical protein MRY76_15210, partial [Pseudomonadales bacterium]|nr:hypothetical protein [Pseudomonadales bacterium]
MLEIATIRKADKALITFGGLFVAVYILANSSFSLGEEVGITEILVAYIAPAFMFLGLSVLPYLIFYLISESIARNGRPPKYSRISLLITVFLIPISCWLYFAAGKDIED